MICDLCTIDILAGTMFRTFQQKRIRTTYSGFVVCEQCLDAVRSAIPETVDERWKLDRLRESQPSTPNDAGEPRK